MVLGHDVTKVIPGEFKGPAFRRGYIIRKEYIPELLSMGKEHVPIIEEEAALRIARAVSGPGVERETGLEPATTCLEGCEETSY